ncbi:hypothetical protein N657DRAFT_654788 [Parathielavia appendiculata]|uniref:Uncharacterized protein n=1 Tax=Parathielavia appendiculata TaxID=2587402 RepID=A0AAN6Z6V1_9PEZI|nr:hypothetical protein N657DRAFT_654788 [Parathielavia appendiculata]
MPLWPFRRKSRRRRGRANMADQEEHGGLAPGAGLPPRSQTVPEVAMAHDDAPAPERQGSKRQRTETNKLHRRPRAYSFSPGRDDAERVGRKKSARAQRGTNAFLPHGSVPQTMATPGMDAARDEMLWRVPTLHNKRDGDHLPRKMSTKKRRKNDPQREAEIKAMSNFAPVRPAAEDWMAGRPVKKESRRMRTGIGVSIKGTEFDKYNRSSDISLPLPESIDTALSSDSDYISYKVSALEALAPRPTLRYTTHPKPGASVRDGEGLVRRPSQPRTKLTEQIPEATLKAHKRIDNLADDLTASDLRELMERDQRRRARKRQLEQERMERRIARRAEKQKAAEAEAERHGRESPPNMERGILGREDVGLGLDPASAIVTSSRIRHPDELREVLHGSHGSQEPREIATSRDGNQSHPLSAFHRVDSNPLQPPEAPSEAREQHVPSPTIAPSKGSFRRKFSRSKSPQESVPRTEQSETTSKAAEGGTSKGPRSWTSFFRWGNKNKRSSGGPSSFSNTSRDSMQIIQGPVPPAHTGARRMSSGVPKRTMSRFREDLPELPISPPPSRLQSPDAEAIRPMGKSSTDSHATATETYPSPPASRPRRDTLISEQQSVEAMRQTPSTFSHPDEPGVSPEPQAMSLASIDSEGSWFSGRLAKKRKSSGILDNASGLRLPRRTPESDSERRPEQEHGAEDMDIADDDYLSRLTPSHGERSAWNRKSTGEARPSSDWGDDEAHWGSVKGQQPTVVRSHPVGRVKSREGLLKSSDTLEQADQDGSSDGSEEAGLQRATSIDYGKAHARRISAGSARLLSITPRSSVDAKHAIMAQTDKA